MPLLIQLYEKNPITLVLLILATVVGGGLGLILVVQLTKVILKVVAILVPGVIIGVLVLTLLGRRESTHPVEAKPPPSVEAPDDPAVTAHPSAEG